MHRYEQWPLWAIPGGPGFNRQRAYDHITREMSVALAGSLAKAIHTGKRLARIENDEEYALELTWDLEKDPEARDAWVDDVRKSTTKLLRTEKVWAAVEALAERLQRHSILSGRVTRSILRKYLPLDPQPDERYSHEEMRWCRVEDARLLAAGMQPCPRNTHNTIRLADVVS